MREKLKLEVNRILVDIKKKREELINLYEQLKKEYWFSIKKKKVIFTLKAREYNKLFKKSWIKSIFSARFREILSIPFIYWVFFPVVFMDIVLFIYQQTAFRLYKIPLVRRKDYIVYDRKYLDYLNWIQKFNCMYCSYVNWFFSYAVEIAWRTEKYRCPIKHAHRVKWWHDWQEYFADYGDPEAFKKVFTSIEEYKNIKEIDDKKV